MPFSFYQLPPAPPPPKLPPPNPPNPPKLPLPEEKFPKDPLCEFRPDIIPIASQKGKLLPGE